MTEKFHVLIFFAVYMCLFGCRAGTTEYALNESIDPQLIQEIIGLENTLIASLKESNVKDLNEILSDDLFKDSEISIEQFASLVSSKINLNNPNVIERWHTRSTTAGLRNNAVRDMNDPNGYTITYKAINKEMFISLIDCPGDQWGSSLITCIWGKYPEGWKVNILRIGDYSILGKTSPHYYRLAKKYYESNYTLDAYIAAQFGLTLIAPASQFMVYNQRDEMTSFLKKVIDEVNGEMKFPTELTEISSSPKILLIRPEIYNDETATDYCPKVIYQTNFKLDDEKAISDEVNAIHSFLVERFDLAVNNDKISYSIVDRIPQGEETVMPVNIELSTK